MQVIPDKNLGVLMEPEGLIFQRIYSYCIGSFTLPLPLAT